MTTTISRDIKQQQYIAHNERSTHDNNQTYSIQQTAYSIQHTAYDSVHILGNEYQMCVTASMSICIDKYVLERHHCFSHFPSWVPNLPNTLKKIEWVQHIWSSQLWQDPSLMNTYIYHTYISNIYHKDIKISLKIEGNRAILVPLTNATHPMDRWLGNILCEGLSRVPSSLE